MSAKDYIIDTLKHWERMFPGIILKYAYEDYSSYHVITVEPHDLYANNEIYAEEELKFWNDFYDNFPNEDMLVSEPNCCLEMKNLLYPDAVPEIDNNHSFNKVWKESLIWGFPYTFNDRITVDQAKNDTTFYSDGKIVNEVCVFSNKLLLAA